MESKSKKLRSGYTTGACAAAAAKAATMLLMRNAECGMPNAEKILNVEIPFPDGSRAAFKIHDAGCRMQKNTTYASVIKDAGDDPDVTNGAEIRAEVSLNAECGMRPALARALVVAGCRRNAELSNPEIIIKGGKGVGAVTKPGLAMPVGEAAINPVPRRMIREAVMEALTLSDSQIPHSASRIPHLEITISVPEGEALAKKTLNHRLGIIGGISILGTTGIVKPLSDEAWTATVSSSMDVARAMGREEVVLSTGRTSEKAHQKKYGLPEDSYVMMGDYTEFSLREAKQHGFKRIHLVAQWAKMIKIAMATPQTHVRHGALVAEKAVDLLSTLGIKIPRRKEFNTTREIYDFIYSEIRDPQSAMETVCIAAKRYAEEIASGAPVIVHLVSYEGEILADSE